MLEPRDESLMRKKKVIEILKTFQEPQEGEEPNKKAKDSNNFCEQFEFVIPKNTAENYGGGKKKSHSNVPISLQSFKQEL